MEATLNLWELIRQGGMAMYPLVLCSVVTLAVIAERAWVLWRVVRPGRRLTAALLGRVTRRELDEARVIVRPPLWWRERSDSWVLTQTTCFCAHDMLRRSQGVVRFLRPTVPTKSPGLWPLRLVFKSARGRDGRECEC